MQALYDLSPLALLMLGGVALALLPLAWIWYQHRRATPLRRWRALALLTLFLTFDLVMFGAFTRLTDSGLGCPDWPGCYGKASPIGARADIAAAQNILPSGPVTHGKAWVEMIHRYLATGVGVLVLVLTATSWVGATGAGERERKTTRRSLGPWWPTLTLVWICIQGAFGALTVTMKLFPAIVTLHLLGGLMLLAMLCVQVVRSAQLERLLEPTVVDPGLRWLTGLTFALLALQLALGGWVSANYAVLACTDFPLCQNRWWPVMDFEQGFELWRELGLTAAGQPINFAALTAIHYVHRLAAWIVLLALAVLAWRLNRVVGLRAQSRWIAALIGLQLATGLGNVVFDWPLLVAVLHTGGAGALVIVMTWVLVSSRTRTSVAPDLATWRRPA